MRNRTKAFWVIFFGFILFRPVFVKAGVVELSGSFSFSQSSYGGVGYQWTRRYAVSAGYYFLALSEIEFSVQDVMYRTKISNVEDTTFHDQIYSLLWVQSFLPKEWVFQPFVKIGAGQLNREASGSYWGGGNPPSIYDSLTVVAGFGVRISILRRLALRGEGTTYLSGGVLSSWLDNFALNGGVSIYF